MILVKKICLGFILCSMSLFSQNKDVDNQLVLANKAVETKDYKTAIKIYKKIARNYPANSDVQVNLAKLYFLTDDKEKGCECAFTAASLNDEEADKLVETNCDDFKKGEVKLLKHVDVPPMFFFTDGYHNLFEDGQINPDFFRLVASELKETRFTSVKNSRDVIVDLIIDKHGRFVGKINDLSEEIRFGGNERELMLYRKSLESVFKHKIKFKPALYRNKPVEIFERFTFPLPNF